MSEENKTKLDSSVTVLNEQADRLIAHLPNRMILVTQEIKGAPVVSVNCFVKCGQIFQVEDKYFKGGISHYLEHLLSGGTTSTRSEKEINKIVGMLGARPNAYTSTFEVNYYISGASKDTSTLVNLISDAMANSELADAEVKREHDVILREIDMGRGEPNRIFWKLTNQARFKYHPAMHPTIGYEEDFKKLTKEDLNNFYKLMYAPNNLIFVVTGNIDKVKVMNQLAAFWKDKKAVELPEIKWPAEKADKPAHIKKQAGVKVARMRMMFPGVKIASEHDYALDVLGQVLGQGELSRLIQEIRNKRGLVSSISSFNYSATWHEGFFGIDAQLDEKYAEEVKKLVLEHIEKIKAEGITEAELKRAQNKTLAATVFAAQDATSASRRVATDLMQMGDPDYLKTYAKKIQMVTVDQVKAAANAILHPEKLSTVMLLPGGGKDAAISAPADKTIPEDMAWNTYEIDNKAIIEKLSARKSMKKDAADAGTSPIEMITLDNGLRVLLQKDTRLPIVTMQWYKIGGLLADEPGKQGKANAAMRMLTRGAAGKSANEIALMLEERGASLSAGCGNNTFLASASCLKGDQKDMLNLLADVILKPDFDEKEWSRLQPRLVAGAKQANDRWNAELNNAFKKIYYKDHPWSSPVIGHVEVIEQLKAEDLKQFYYDRLNAGKAVLAVFGDIDRDTVIAQIKARFSELPKEAKVPFVKPANVKFEAGRHIVKTDKPVHAVQIVWGPGIDRKSEDYAALQVLTRVMSNFPTGWIDQSLRGKEGLSYAAWSYPVASYVKGYWTAAFNTRKSTSDLAESRVIANIKRINTELIDDETLQRARTASIVRSALGEQTIASRATQAALDELYGVGYNANEALNKKIESITAQDVMDVAKKYLSSEPLVIILEHEDAKPAE